MASQRAIGAFAAVLLSVVAACGAKESAPQAVDLRWRIEPEPATRGPAVVHVELHDSRGAPLTGASLRVEGNMNHAGMVPVFGEGQETAPGSYEAPLELTMGGDWILTFEARLADGTRHVQEAALRGVRVR